MLKETDTRQGDCGEDGNVRMAPPSLYGEGDDVVYYIFLFFVYYIPPVLVGFSDGPVFYLHKIGVKMRE